MADFDARRKHQLVAGIVQVIQLNFFVVVFFTCSTADQGSRIAGGVVEEPGPMVII
jgi:hypothetical protein